MDAGRLRKPTSSKKQCRYEMSGLKSGKAQAAKRVKNAGSGICGCGLGSELKMTYLFIVRPSPETRCAHNYVGTCTSTGSYVARGICIRIPTGTRLGDSTIPHSTSKTTWHHLERTVQRQLLSSSAPCRSASNLWTGRMVIPTPRRKMRPRPSCARRAARRVMTS